jgi:hypothetical protein
MLDIALQMGEKVFINFIISKVKNVLYCIFHFIDVKAINCFQFYTFDIELVIDLFFNILSIGLQINYKTIFSLLDLLHETIILFSIKIILQQYQI